MLKWNQKFHITAIFSIVISHKSGLKIVILAYSISLSLRV